MTRWNEWGENIPNDLSDEIPPALDPAQRLQDVIYENRQLFAEVLTVLGMDEVAFNDYKQNDRFFEEIVLLGVNGGVHYAAAEIAFFNDRAEAKRLKEQMKNDDFAERIRQAIYSR